jgi:hypothetical protein
VDLEITENKKMAVGTLPPELFAQQQQLNRQQQMAQMLMQQGTQQPQGQMVSGQYVQPSIFAQLASLAQMYAGTQMAERGDKRALDLAAQLRKQYGDEIKEFRNLMQGREQLAPEQAGPTQTGQAIPQEMVRGAPNVQGAYDFAATASNPALQAAGLRKLTEGPMKVGAEDVLLDPVTMQPIFKGAGKTTSEMQNFNFAKTPEGGGFKGSFTDFKNEVTPYQQQRLSLDREKFEFDKSQKGAGKDLTESQGKASAFQSQMVSASNAVNTLEGQGFDPTSFKSQTAVKLAGGVANPAIPVAAQQYKQAQDQWSEAYLRFKTGAAATEPEVVRNNRTFFPVFGDKPEQIAQKAAAREQAERDIGIAAGRGSNLGAQPIGQQPRQPATPKTTSLPNQSAIDAELKRRGL